MRKRKEKTSRLAEEALKNVQDPLQKEILNHLQRVQFKRRLFGGVDEADVWRKIGELNSLYERVLLSMTENKGDANE